MCTSILINWFNQSASRRKPQLSGAVGLSPSAPTRAPPSHRELPKMMLSGTGTPSQDLPRPWHLGTGCSPAQKVVFSNTSGSAELSPGSSPGQLFLSVSDSPLSFPTGRSGSPGINLHSLQVHIICRKMPILGEQPQKGGIYYTITLGEVSATLILL